MATAKKQVFDIPFIGYDYGKDFNWDFDVLLDNTAIPSSGSESKTSLSSILLIRTITWNFIRY
jgi:hypothetical protein